MEEVGSMGGGEVESGVGWKWGKGEVGEEGGGGEVVGRWWGGGGAEVGRWWG